MLSHWTLFRQSHSWKLCLCSRFVALFDDHFFPHLSFLLALVTLSHLRRCHLPDWSFLPTAKEKKKRKEKLPTYEHKMFPIDARVPLTTMRRGSAAPIRAAALGNKVMSTKSSQSPLILCENVESSATFSLPSLCLLKILCKSREVGWHSLHMHYLFILTYF